MPARLTAEEIRERIHKEGNRDPGGMVVLSRSRGGTRHVYHDPEDPCVDFGQYNYRAGPERVSRREARERGLAPCAQCLVTPLKADTHDYEPYLVADHFDPEKHDSIADARADLRQGVSD